jgi:hypothetical protein
VSTDDTWAPGGGDVRRILSPTVNAAVIFGYVLKSPFGGDGKIKHTNNEHQIYTKPTMTPPREMKKVSP